MNEKNIAKIDKNFDSFVGIAVREQNNATQKLYAETKHGIVLLIDEPQNRKFPIFMSIFLERDLKGRVTKRQKKPIPSDFVQKSWSGN